MKFRFLAATLLLVLGAIVLRTAFTEVAEAKSPVQVTINWEKMTHEEKEDYMRNVVMPRMRKVFAEFDAEKFPKINCKTCHGDGATNETFKMPNAKLPKLPSKDEGWTKLNEKKPEMMKFMMQVVKPEMAKLLQIPQKDEHNPKGFGCNNCHVM